MILDYVVLSIHDGHFAAGTSCRHYLSMNCAMDLHLERRGDNFPAEQLK